MSRTKLFFLVSNTNFVVGKEVHNVILRTNCLSRLGGVGDGLLTQQKNIPLTRILATTLQGPSTAWLQEPIQIQRKELRSITGYNSHCFSAYFR